MSTWNTLTFASGSLLTSEKMTKVDENFDALAEGSSGAPKIQPAAIDTTKDFTVNKLTVGNSLVIPATTRYLFISPNQMKIGYSDENTSTHRVLENPTQLNSYNELCPVTSAYASAGITAYSGIYLPNGAIITGFKFYCYSGNASSVVQASLLKSDANGTLTSLASTWANIPGSGYQSNANADPLAEVIDNTSYCYSARCIAIGLGTDGTKARICGLRISYTIAAPLP